jgi:hypothetical protein
MLAAEENDTDKKEVVKPSGEIIVLAADGINASNISVSNKVGHPPRYFSDSELEFGA